jgi:hypothetical protein
MSKSISVAEYKALIAKPPPKMKYRNKPKVINGERYDSIKESVRHAELMLMEKAGEIERLERQVPFLLMPAQMRIDGTKEREVHYFADFVYYDNKLQRLVVEDVKSRATVTKDYVLKRKLMLMQHAISVMEV